MSSPTACIIGAGISGLTAGKNLADYGIAYDCFETSDRIGGNWSFGNPNGHSSAYRSLHIDTSKDLLSFKDFPMADVLPGLPAPLGDPHLPRGLRRAPSGSRTASASTTASSTPSGSRAAAGSCAPRTARRGASTCSSSPTATTGIRATPDFPGSFDGETIHSHHYIDPTEPLDLRGKRILVVGIGNSAADIVSELSQKVWGNTVILSTRSGAWVVPKYVFGRPHRQDRAHDPACR